MYNSLHSRNIIEFVSLLESINRVVFIQTKLNVFY